MTMADPAPCTALDAPDVGPMLAAYSEKLMQKEDALRSREEDLEAVGAAAVAIEGVLRGALGPADPAHSAGSTPPAMSPRAGLHRRSTSALRDLRTGHPTPSTTGDEPWASPPTTTAAAAAAPAANGRSAIGSAPLLVDALKPLAEMAAAELLRLRTLAGGLERDSQAAAAELLETRQELGRLRDHCSRRASQEDAVQQDIVHVLAQISRLRNKIVQLEHERDACEAEAATMRQRYRQAEAQTAEQVLQLIVDRVGKRDWEARRALDPDATAPPAARPLSTDAVSEPAGSLGPDPGALTRFSSLGTVSVSHPEASDIRAEFNELMHQVISRRDEDIERMQALADAWRADAHRAVRETEQRAWNTGTRGTQTA